MYKKVLLATDGSEDSIRATKKVIELQKQTGCKVVAFYSIEHHMIPQFLPTGLPFFNVKPYSIPATDYARLRAEYETAGKILLDETKKMFEAENTTVELRIIRDKSPENYIKKIVKDEKFDLVVLACKGHHSKLREVFLGTVAESALNNADCDVLVVR